MDNKFAGRPLDRRAANMLRDNIIIQTTRVERMVQAARSWVAVSAINHGVRMVLFLSKQDSNVKILSVTEWYSFFWAFIV
jgi:hypothetical protein